MCAQSITRARLRSPAIWFTCERCGRQFREKPSAKPRFCSWACYSPPSRAERFWAKVDKTGENGCWLWTGATTTKGYGHMRWGGKTVTASRVSWELAHGPITDGLHVLHHCDNPPCVNPAHLFLGTIKDNSQDMTRKGRGKPPRMCGAQLGIAKVDEDAVRAIRQRYAEGGVTYEALGREFGISGSQIARIVRRLFWRQVE